MAPPMKPLASIQYLRGLAALAVVAFHAFQWGDGGFDVGRAGVDVFFVISGVIMWRVTAERETAPLAFLWRRLTRVAPLYWLLTAVVGAVALAWPAFLPNVHPGWKPLLLSLAFIPHFDPAGLPFPLLPPGWTLNYEAIFYVVVAATLLAPRANRAWLIAGALFVIVAAGVVLADPAYILGANPLLLEFAAGVAVAALADRRALPGRRWSWRLIAAGLAALAIPAALGLFNELWRPLIWGLPAMLIVAGALGLERSGGVGRSPALMALGDASYSIYLIHLPASAVVAHILGINPPWLFIPAAIAASTLAGLACHRWVERPLIRWTRTLGARAERQAEAAA